LDRALRTDGNGAGRPPSHARDPEAERAALDSFIAGLARAQDSPTNR
jgi:hypothetical protein